MVARYRLLARTYIKPDDHLEASLHEAGAEFDYSGVPGNSMEPLNAEAVEAKASRPPITDSMKNIWPKRGDPS
jgi:hypothetical protein